MIRATSKAAYRDTDTSKRRAEVLAMMRTRQDWTRQEIADELGWPISSVCGRVFELREMGAIVEMGRCRKNPATGKSVNVVRVA